MSASSQTVASDPHSVAPQVSSYRRLMLMARICVPPAILAAIISVFWCLYFFLAESTPSTSLVSSAALTWISVAVGIAVSVRASYAMERYTTASRQYKQCLMSFGHFVQYSCSQTLRAPLANKKLLPFENVLDGSFREVSVFDVLAEAEWLCRAFPYAVRHALSLSTESIDFRTMVDVQRPHMERAASMVDMLQQEVHLLGPCPESLLAAIIRRLTFLIEHGLLHTTTGQVAFRALNSSNFSLASAHAARRTIVPLVVRDFLLSIMIFYIVFLPALVWASLGWFSVLFCGLVGGTFGGLLSSIEQLRRSQFNDDERLFIGINTHSWAVDAECTVATSFSSLWITAKVFGGEHWTEWALKRASVSGFKSS